MKQHTIVMLVGPSCCGKSTFAQKFKVAADSENLKCVIISSDDIRRELLGDTSIHKMDARMQEVSNQAFKILEQRVDFHSSFPINTDVLVVDTTGLSEEFRDSMIAIANKNHYNIDMFVFDYPRSDLEGFVQLSDGDMYVTGRQMKKLREEVMPKLNRKAYGNVQIFKKPEDAAAWMPIIENRSNVVHASETDKIVIVGDIHECVEEFQSLLMKLPTDILHLALLGDLIDKGNNTANMIELVHGIMTNSLIDCMVYLVRGNHERYVYKRLKGILQPNDKLDNEFFQSYQVLSQNEELRNKFFHLYENVMVDQLKFVRGREKSIILTHAPCSNLYLDKHDSKSVGKQVNFYFSSRDPEKMLEELKFIEDEANSNHPWHLFGHVAHDGRQPKVVKNKVFMDTGCVHGGKLSAAVFNGRHMDFITVDSRHEVHGLISLEKKETKLEKILRSEIRLSEEDEKTVSRVIKGGAKFISGTMAPASANGLDIESLESALEYFKTKVDKVVMQPKYMGSRCQFYLYKDRTKNFAVSRNGYKIKIDGLQEYMASYQDRVEKSVKFNDELILDGELLPWSALGKGLIEGQFLQYGKAIEYTLEKLASDPVFGAFDLGKKYDAEGRQVDLHKFDHQMWLYGRDKPLEYKAFDILMLDGELLAGKQNVTCFFVLNGDGQHIVDFADPDYFQKANSYFDTLTFEREFEGAVIKPISYDQANSHRMDSAKFPCVPYMKVRNKEYLRLVYGFDYTSRLESLCKQKSTKGKSALSIDEYELGRAMLVEKDTEKRNHLISAMFGKIAQERTMDPRL